MALLTRTETLEGVTRLHAARTLAGRPTYWTSCYLLPGDPGPVLVDALAPRTARFIPGKLPATPAECLLTHHHEDHVGAAHRLRDQGIRVRAPAATSWLLEKGYHVPFYRHLVWGTPKRTPVAPIHVAVVDTPAGHFRVIPTPGHAHDMVAYLHEETKWLYCGDAYLGRLRAARFAEDVATWRDTLRMLAKVDCEKALPAHGPVLDEPDRAFTEAADWLDDLAARAKKLRAGGTGLREVRRELLGSEPWLSYISGGEFSGVNLVRGVLTMET